MTTEAEKFASLILKGVAEHAPESAGTPIGGTDFCKIWPKAKPILELLVGIVAFIPGAGTVAAGVLSGLIKVGDQIATQVCK